MTFWIVTTLLAMTVALVLALVLMRGRVAADPAASYDIRVYRDQMKDVERDIARGVIAPEDADRVRTEIARRILAADSKADAASAAMPQARTISAVTGAVVAVAVVAGSLLLYRDLGAPGYGDLALQRRIEMAETARAERPRQAQAEASVPVAPVPADLSETYLRLIERLRATVAERPEDLEGQMLLARNEAAIGQFAAAHAAQAEVVRLKGDAATGRDLADLADMMILAAGGYVSPEAEAALDAALERDPGNGVARYYRGLMLAQTGRPDLAFSTWNQLLIDSTPESPWTGPVLAQIGDVAFRAGVEFTPPASVQAPQAPQPGPSAADVEAASQMSDEDRAAMIRTMVDGLAERLGSEGGPPQDWARLIAALGVLGEQDQARAILDNALEAFAGNTEALALIAEAARRAGINE